MSLSLRLSVCLAPGWSDDAGLSAAPLSFTPKLEDALEDKIER